MSQEPTRTLLVYHYGQGLELDLVTLKAVKLCEAAEVALKTGSPYGTIAFENEQLSQQFMQ